MGTLFAFRVDFTKTHWANYQVCFGDNIVLVFVASKNIHNDK
jgi:hypothetical protein